MMIIRIPQYVKEGRSLKKQSRLDITQKNTHQRQTFQNLDCEETFKT